MWVYKASHVFHEFYCQKQTGINRSYRNNFSGKTHFENNYISFECKHWMYKYIVESDDVWKLPIKYAYIFNF